MRRELRSPAVVSGAALVVTLTLVGVLAPLLAPYDPRALTGAALEPPSPRHWLGTNDIGQDILSELVWGTRWSLSVAAAAAALAVGLGVAVGVTAGLRGGLADAVTMRALDTLLALPLLPLLILVAALAGPSWSTIVVTMGLLAWPLNARILRSQTLTLRERGFVEAARGFGGGTWYVVQRHLVPAVGPLVVTGFINVASIAIVLEAGLAFLGLADPGGMSWGLILNRALGHQGVYYGAAWTWWVLPAGVAISLAVLGFTLLGIGLEPILNRRIETAA